jgi:manganese/zinc/iron transport system permease protein
MAGMVGVVFGVVFVLAPGRGLLAQFLRRRRQRWEFALAMLTIHLYTHEGLPEAAVECRADHLTDHLAWSEGFARQVVDNAIRRRHTTLENGILKLTDKGRDLARQAIVNWAPQPS